jgi:triosephosphate isomerase
MLARLGATTVLCGHSERRALYGMDDDAVARTVAAARRAGLMPMVCVGERAEEREAGETEAVLERQLRSALGALRDADPERCSVAYEPVWAIGTGDAATPDDAQAACALLRGVAAEGFGDGAARLRILYGGSTSPANAAGLVEPPDVDGLLVGGASLTASDFADVVIAVADCYRAGARPPRR